MWCRIKGAGFVFEPLTGHILPIIRSSRPNTGDSHLTRMSMGTRPRPARTTVVLYPFLNLHLAPMAPVTEESPNHHCEYVFLVLLVVSFRFRRSAW
jgi:hypothetical protein